MANLENIKLQLDMVVEPISTQKYQNTFNSWLKKDSYTWKYLQNYCTKFHWVKINLVLNSQKEDSGTHSIRRISASAWSLQSQKVIIIKGQWQMLRAPCWIGNFQYVVWLLKPLFLKNNRQKNRQTDRTFLLSLLAWD